jgi:curved DNA-binding protein CbpA
LIVDHYGRLGVTRTATHAEIRTAYRRMAQRLHPDTHGGVVSAEMVAINEAWRVLSDQRRRSAYDATLRVDTPPAAPPQWASWSPAAGSGSDDEDDDFVDDDPFLGPMAETVAVRRWMALIAFTMVAAGILLTALFVYAFMRSGTTGR